MKPKLRERDTNPIITFSKPSRTKQSFAKEANINYIMERYTRTGQLPTLIKKEPAYGDFSKSIDYQESLNIVTKAQTQFDALPSTTRKFFNHDPSRMLEFCSDPQNTNQMIKLGLAIPKASVTGDKQNNTNINTKVEEKNTKIPSTKVD